MKKQMLSLLACLACFTAPVVTAEVELVLTYDKVEIGNSVKVARSAATLTQTCLFLDGINQPVCVPVIKSSKAQEMSGYANSVGGAQHQTKTIQPRLYRQAFRKITVDVDSALQDKLVAELQKTGYFVAVEADVPVTNLSIGAQGDPNDPYFSYQPYLLARDEHASGSNFKSLLSETEQKSVAVAVLDSGFVEHVGELEYDRGLSFVKRQNGQPGSEYLMTDEDIQQGCSAHGAGVAAVISANTDNQKLIAGAAGTVELHGLEVLSCDSGNLSDAADALVYLADENRNRSDGSLPISIANLSLGGKADGCPVYMQQAVNYANEQGISVIVSSGNAGEDASGYAPANCSGVITVGATDERGDFASFANFGGAVDVSAQGVSIASLNSTPGNVVLWSGTSFSAPLVASAAAHAVRKFPQIEATTLADIMRLTVSEIDDPDCATKGCGKGVVDAQAMSELAGALNQNNASTIFHALQDEAECEQIWYIEHFGERARLCELYAVNLIDAPASLNAQFEVYRSTLNDTQQEDELLVSTNESSILLRDIDTEQYTYYYRVCRDGDCNNAMRIELNIEQLQRPQNCL